MRIFNFIKNCTFIYFVCGFKGILFYFSFLWFIFYQVFEMTKHTDWTLVNIWLVIQCFTIKLKLAAGRCWVEHQTKVHEDFTIMEKASTDGVL